MRPPLQVHQLPGLCRELLVDLSQSLSTQGSSASDPWVLTAETCVLQAGVPCGPHCKCTNCQNCGSGPGGPLGPSGMMPGMPLPGRRATSVKSAPQVSQVGCVAAHTHSGRCPVLVPLQLARQNMVLILAWLLLSNVQTGLLSQSSWQAPCWQ